MKIDWFPVLVLVAAGLTALAAFQVKARVHLGWAGVTVFFIALLVR